MKTITFCSFKGGTGKTTLSVNVGSNLVQYRGKKVLLVDLDPQANLTSSLGVQVKQKSLNDVFRHPQCIQEAIYKTKIENLEIIPSNTLIEDFREINFDFQIFGKHLSHCLQEVKDVYDICILDTPPSLGLLTKEAFIASNYLIICLTPEPFSILGLQKIKEFCLSLNLDQSLEVLGIVFSFWDERNSTNSTYLNIIESIYENKIFSSKVRRDVALSRSLLKETSVINAYPNSRAAQDILKLSKEIEEKLFNKLLFSQETL
uniref:Chromosome/plasmid partitioning protein ParA n=1 Tax=Chlamydia pecorum TaxID=85991 RepID=A0A0N9DZ57_9CHLA|nr:ParA family protein [Chlamydia pecorum]ALF35304.1 Chromosome/plasmid partitioning protein ParA [Chlamydia pecorum]